MNNIAAIILAWSIHYNIDPTLVTKIIKVESNYNVNAIGEHGEIGLMQLKPESFPEYKKKELFNPNINIMLGIKYLAEVKEKCKHKYKNTFVICYNKGVTGGSKINYPKLDSYYIKINKE